MSVILPYIGRAIHYHFSHAFAFALVQHFRKIYLAEFSTD